MTEAMTGWTIQKLLGWVTRYFTEKEIDSPRLSAELLLSAVLSMSRLELYTSFSKPVQKEQLDELHKLVKRASQHEPIAYLIGKTEFYSIELEVSRDCLIPRPETELLVENAITFLRNRTGRQQVCDLCTGCGCIAVAIAKNFPEAHIIATDIRDAALAVAEKNIEKHRLQGRISLLCGDLFEPLIPQIDTAKFDLIVCNPPYVSCAEYETLARNVREYEPKISLCAGVDGLDIYRKIAEKVSDFLKRDSALMLEVGSTQGQAVSELLRQAGFSKVEVKKDFQEHDRVIIAKRQQTCQKERTVFIL